MAEYLQYGALGLLTIVLLAAGAFVRQMWASLDANRKFTEDLAKTSLEKMQQVATTSTVAQADMAQAVRELIVTLQRDRLDSQSEHERIMEIIRDSRSDLGRESRTLP